MTRPPLTAHVSRWIASQLANDALGSGRLQAEIALRRARNAGIAGDHQSAATTVQSAIDLAWVAGDKHFEALWRTGDLQGDREKIFDTSNRVFYALVLGKVYRSSRADCSLDSAEQPT